MLRKMILVLAAVMAVVQLTSAAAQADVNLHNGYIEVVDHITYNEDLTGVIDRSKLHGIPKLPFDVDFYSPSYGVGYGKVRMTNGVAIMNHCCVLAGSFYTVTGMAMNQQEGNRHVVIAGAHFKDTMKAALCNVRGIPFGFIRVVLFGMVTYKPYEYLGRIRNEWKVHQLRYGVNLTCP